MPEPLSTSISRKRPNEISADDTDCEIIHESIAKRSKPNSVSTFLRSVKFGFQKVADWFKSGQSSNLNASRLFSVPGESNSAAAAIADGGQYLDEATTDKFMPRHYGPKTGSCFENRDNGGGASQAGFSTGYSFVNGSHQSRRDHTLSVSPENQNEARGYQATNCETIKKVDPYNRSVQTTAVSSFAASYDFNREQTQKHSSKGVHTFSVNETLQNTAASTPDLRNKHDPVEISGNGGDMNSSLQKSYAACEQSGCTQSSVYDVTFAPTNTSSQPGTKRGVRRTIVEKCFDLEEKERYKRLLERLSSQDMSTSQEHRLANFSTNPHASSVNQNAIRKPLFLFGQKSRDLLGKQNDSFHPQEISTPLGPAGRQHGVGVQICNDTPTKMGTVNAWKAVAVTPKDSLTKNLRKSVTLEKESMTPSRVAQECDLLMRKLQEMKESASRRLHDMQIADQERKVAAWEAQRKEDDQHLERMIKERLKLNVKVFIDDITVDEKEVADEFPVLGAEQEAIVNSALARGPNDILSDGFNLKIKRADVATLTGLNWLNDEVINFYMNLIMERSEDKDRRLPTVYVFNTFFYPKLMKEGHDGLKRWTRRVDLFSKDLLIIPVHLGMHWCLATIDFRHCTLKYFDSMGGHNSACLEALRRYLEAESLDKKKASLDTSQWKAESVKNIPQQMNGSDCGVFACKYAEYVSRDAKFTFSQEHMPYFRRRMVYEIVTKKLL